MAEISKQFTTEQYEAIYSVETEENGLRLDLYVQKFLPSFSREQVKRKIERGEVQILERTYPHKPSVKVYAGEVVRIFTPKGNLEDEYWNGEPLQLQLDPEILFENDDLVVISKPAYMTTHPTGRHLFNCATVYFETMYKKTVHSIHRIDRETSGVLLLGKNPEAANQMTTLFEKEEVKKCYFFMAHNRHLPASFPHTAKERLGHIDDYIPRLYVHCFDELASEGKHAETTFLELYRNEEYFLGLAFPKTGRQHQIRSHAAHHGFPLIGDKLYNGDPKIFMRFKDGVATEEDHEKMQISRHALHATGLFINWPSKENPTLFRAPIPKDFKEWMSENIKEVDIGLIEKKIDAIIEDRFRNQPADQKHP